MTDQYEEFGLRLTVEGPVATVAMCRPEQRNAQSPRMWAALAEIGETLPADVRVVVVKGDGASFSAGLDTRMLTVDGIPGDTSLADLLGSEDAALEHVERTLTVRSALDVLDDRSREILRLRFQEELTQAAIGERVGLSQMHVSRLIRQALETLRAASRPDDGLRDAARDAA